MKKHKHLVKKDYTFQFYQGVGRMSVDIEGSDLFVLRNRYGTGLLVGSDEIDDAIALLTKVKEDMEQNKI